MVASCSLTAGTAKLLDGPTFVCAVAKLEADAPQPAASGNTTVSVSRAAHRENHLQSVALGGPDDRPCAPGGTGIWRRIWTSDPADERIIAVCVRSVPTVNSVHSLIQSPAVDASHTKARADADAISQDEPLIGLGPGLRRAWIGYQLRLDRAMAAAGFGERRFPDGRVLRLCSKPAGSTISGIGREIGITRQGAAKVVMHLAERGYVSVADSASSGREKSVTLTARGNEYLAVQRSAAQSIEADLRATVGQAGFSALGALLEALGAEGETPRIRDYLRHS